MKTTLRTLALFATSLPLMVWSQGVSLTGKPNNPVPAPSSAPLIDFWGIAQLAVALGLVAALIKWGLPWVMKKMRADSSSKGTIQVLESMSLGAAQLQLVKALDRTLLIGVTAQSTRLIADLTETGPSDLATALAEPASAAAASAPKPTPAPAAPATKIDVRVDEDDRVFFEMIDEAMEEEPLKPQPKKIKKAPVKAVISRQIEEQDQEDADDMTFQQALALIQAAKKRSGLDEPEPVAASKPRTRLPDPAKAAKAARPMKSVVQTAAFGAPSASELTDREIQDALDRIKRLSR